MCSARWSLGGLSFRTRYVTFRPPDLAEVKLVNTPPFLADWAASIRHRDMGEGSSEVVYTPTFRCRPAALARVLEPAALAVFRWETAKRLWALATHLGGGVRAARTRRAYAVRRRRRDRRFPSPEVPGTFAVSWTPGAVPR